MSNKIDGFGSRPATVTGGNRGGAVEQSGDAESTSVGATSGDSVTLTEGAVRLQRLAQAVADAPATDTSRIASVKEAVTRGEYSINPERVADKILQAERELIGR
jgi:negative regulator of flagellin synthesis FlgM